MTNSQLKQNAKATLKGNWGTVICIVLVQGLITALAASLGVGIASLILAGPLAFGLTFAFISLTRTQKTEFNHLFKGFESFGATCITGILHSVYIFLWTLLFFVPGFVKTYSYAMTYYILNDNPALSANDAITESRKMMDGNKMNLFILDLTFIGWYILSAFTFGILLLYVVPYHNATRAQFYEKIKAEKAAA